VLAACPELDTTARHVRDFADLMTKRRSDRLYDWMHAVAADKLPALHSLITGLRREITAVVTGLTLTWSSGAVEGNVNCKDAETTDVRTSQLRTPPQTHPHQRVAASQDLRQNPQFPRPWLK
jgi:hypothetical protein